MAWLVICAVARGVTLYAHVVSACPITDVGNASDVAVNRSAPIHSFSSDSAFLEGAMTPKRGKGKRLRVFVWVSGCGA